MDQASRDLEVYRQLILVHRGSTRCVVVSVIDHRIETRAGGRPAHQVRVIRNFSKQSDPDGMLSQLSRTDYFVDTQSYLVVRTEDLTHPVESFSESYSHSIEFDRYTSMGGIAVPTAVREKVAGQATWEFRLASITFNTSFQDSDFTIQ